MTTVARNDVIARFGDALASVVGAVTGTTASAQLTDRTPDVGFAVSIEATEGGQGTLHVQFDRAGAEALSTRMAGLAEGPSEAVVLDSLREICNQVLASFADGELSAGVRLALTSVRAAADFTDPGSATLVEIAIEGEDAPLRLALSGTLEFVEGLPSADVQTIEINPGLDVILDMDLPVVVRFGRTEMPLKALTLLGPGSVIELGRSPDDPVDVLVSNQVVATGDVVVVAGNYGVRIREVISPAERVRSMEVGIR